MLAFCKKIYLTHNFLLERFLSLDILVLERGPNLESQTWFQIFTITSHTPKNPSISLNLYFLICTVGIIFALLTSGFIVKIKWTNVFLSLPHVLGSDSSGNPHPPAPHPLCCLASWDIWSLSSCPALKIQKVWVLYREWIWLCLAFPTEENPQEDKAASFLSYS